MKARIKPKFYQMEIPRKIIQNEEYARDFWNRIKEENPDGDYGDSFEDWYDKIKTVDFFNKVKKIEEQPHNKKKKG